MIAQCANVLPKIFTPRRSLPTEYPARMDGDAKAFLGAESGRNVSSDGV